MRVTQDRASKIRERLASVPRGPLKERMNYGAGRVLCEPERPDGTADQILHVVGVDQVVTASRGTFYATAHEDLRDLLDDANEAREAAGCLARLLNDLRASDGVPIELVERHLIADATWQKCVTDVYWYRLGVFSNNIVVLHSDSASVSVLAEIARLEGVSLDSLVVSIYRRRLDEVKA